MLQPHGQAFVKGTLPAAPGSVCNAACCLLWSCWQAEDLKDKLLRTLADMENLRERTSRLTAETKQFAVQVGQRMALWKRVGGGLCVLAVRNGSSWPGGGGHDTRSVHRWPRRSVLPCSSWRAFLPAGSHSLQPAPPSHPPPTKPQGLVKNLLDVADNLERAAGSIPEADLAEGSECDRDRALTLLRSLRDGVLMTDTVLMKVGGR